MIERLQKKHVVSICEFIKQNKDVYHDFYITRNKQRIFLNNTDIISKVLKNQEIYGLFDERLRGLMMIYREKGYRPYIKFFSIKMSDNIDLLKYLMWNFSEQDLYIKLKKSNPFCSVVQKYGFVFIGDRGSEILLMRKGVKKLNKIIPKDIYTKQE